MSTPKVATQRYLRDHVFLGRRRRFSAHKHSVVRMAALAAAFQELLKGTQPATHQVDVLQGYKSRTEVTQPNCRNPTSVMLFFFFFETGTATSLLFPSHLQYDPVALLGSLLHGELSHSLLALAQRHVVELPQVDGESQLPP